MSAASTHSEQEKGQIAQEEYADKSLDAPLLTKEEEKRILRKIDFKLVPFLSLLYLLSFLDRVNIGQAKLDNLVQDLHLKGQEYNIALVTFFVGYVITETPSNIALKKLRPSRWIPFIMICWSVVMTLMGLVHNFAGLTAARFFLGLAESGLFPGICFYLTMWYKRDEGESNLPLSGVDGTDVPALQPIFASPSSFPRLLFRVPSVACSHTASERWKVFIIEGLLTFLVACAAPFLMDDFPEVGASFPLYRDRTKRVLPAPQDAKFLTAEEKVHVVRRLAEDQGAAGEAPFAWSHVNSALKDWVSDFLSNLRHSLALFTPTIISSLGAFTRAESQLLSTPPYFLAFIVTLCSALYSDRVKNRGLFNIFWMTIVVIGYAILCSINPVEKPGVAYFAVFLCVCGVAPSISNTITWAGNNMGPVYKRATGKFLPRHCDQPVKG
ncbi:SPOSA6832_02025 [Sporobolomyces salmonicolor]|uniref:SPOSA6832_02025-mRNA-1:cds n=1 Tax=Sporidiobolus salmonicolor TaxID=5005 RepID=A0A0D6EKJ1_SPOSA|nr:SPOSA6832_02025 [Sporobolomyces salmonicolor]